MSALHVLVYGNLDAGPCDTFRFGMHAGALAAHGVELRAINGADVGVPGGSSLSTAEALDDADAVVDREQLDWADVIVFHRFYQSHWTCETCPTTGSAEELRRHAAHSGHASIAPDLLVRPVFNALERDPASLRGRAIVYETDDDLLGIPGWNGIGQRLAPEVDLVERMLRRADLVTTTTTALADRLRPWSPVVRVVRNAVDPTWYGAPPRVDGPPRAVYYGGTVRRRDYDVCRAAVDEVASGPHPLRRVWIGIDDERDPSGSAAIRSMVDEAHRYAPTPREFSSLLVSVAPSIGLAPLVVEPFNAAKSELHWLEYTMAGAATVATPFPGDGPYNVIRDGVDGILARTPDDWRRAIKRLAASAAYREDLLGRARERIDAEYTVERRAAEWADAYRWAAEHAGRGAGFRVFGLGELPAVEGERQAVEAVAHRARARSEAEARPGRLGALRGDRGTCAPEAGGALVSVVIPVVDESADQLRGAIATAVGQAFRPLEIIVAGEVPADLGVPDAPGIEVRMVAPPPAAVIAVPPAVAHGRAAARALSAGIDAAGGSWIAPLSPECTWPADRLATLVATADEYGLELVYGQATVRIGGAAPVALGDWPPSQHGTLVLGTELVAAPLARLAEVDADAWRDGESPGFAWWREMFEAGARAAMIEVETAVLEPHDAHEGRGGETR